MTNSEKEVHSQTEIDEATLKELDVKTVKELAAIDAQIKKQLRLERVRTARKVYKKLQQIAKKSGEHTIEQIAQLGRNKAKPSKLKTVRPKYRSRKNPENSWSGRGHKPLWLESELKNTPGLKLEDLAIIYPD